MKKKTRPNKNAYYHALVAEVLEDFGKEIFHFRNLQSIISKSSLVHDLDPDLLFLLDSIYQTSFDRIIDGLAGTRDLRVSNVAIIGLEKSLNVRRGLVKREDVI
jgi:hypothetical protein